MQSEGNGYIFEKNNKWEIFYALTKYLENYKFPYDNRNLVKNVLEIKAN
jgi:glycogen synthase